MLTEIDSRLLEKIADLTGKPVGAFNIRKDSGCEARQSTEHIEIVPQPEGKSGIIGSKYPKMDMISFGPTICYPHSPDEKVEIASVGKFYEFMVDTLRNIPKK